MRPFETVDHTADLALVARGKTLSELFANVALGLFTQLADPAGQRAARGERQWRLSAREPEELLIAWLRELLFEHEVDRLAFTDFEVAVEGEYGLTASARAGDLLPGEPLTAIKAVTYHDLRVAHLGEHWEVKVVFDL